MLKPGGELQKPWERRDLLRKKDGTRNVENLVEICEKEGLYL